MHRHQWIIFLPNFIPSRFYVTLYLLSYCVFHFNWCRVYTYICIYMRIYWCVCVYIYICLCACEWMLPCIHDYMYVFYVCSFYVCWFYDFFYLWLLGQRWPNKEVQTNISMHEEQIAEANFAKTVFKYIFEIIYSWLMKILMKFVPNGAIDISYALFL